MFSRLKKPAVWVDKESTIKQRNMKNKKLSSPPPFAFETSSKNQTERRHNTSRWIGYSLRLYSMVQWKCNISQCHHNYVILIINYSYSLLTSFIVTVFWKLFLVLLQGKGYKKATMCRLGLETRFTIIYGAFRDYISVKTVQLCPV